ncbi:anti-anti-sigma factor [Marmoricola sp. Leaf446]|uniref:STAS domain-containing protein n=1 Tax=Marmoricola sp. Leaf446 TaxID=1736379 RepID=UPI0006F335A0|nr:STAS domain-containing protein [Marmoricola sp. Leaf446]KQT89224.1 anti-anti-sigma factor [Marmoricola sp. Leaf446]
MNEYETQVHGGVTVVRAPDRLDMVAAPKLKQLVDRTVQEGDGRVVVDLGGTSFVDSSGLGALIGGLKTARQAGGDLRIAAAGEQVTMVLRLTNLDRILKPHPGVEDAARGW